MYELANNYYVCKITKKAADQALKESLSVKASAEQLAVEDENKRKIDADSVKIKVKARKFN